MQVSFAWKLTFFYGRPAFFSFHLFRISLILLSTADTDYNRLWLHWLTSACSKLPASSRNIHTHTISIFRKTNTSVQQGNSFYVVTRRIHFQTKSFSSNSRKKGHTDVGEERKVEEECVKNKRRKAKKKACKS